ncbi:MAG: hypothetical protein RLZZ15_3097 [Verrucomicrobiota bacterium]|jgi:CPA2 family monovalent cation:H+ antiporter-2
MHGLHFIQDLAVVLVVGGVMGWLCQRAGLSVIAGFLAAGILVGPKSPLVALVHEAASIETLSQIGIVFLMFSIGLGLSLRKLRRLGPALMLATLAGAVTMLYLSRWFGAALGWSATESLFLAGILMVSSSAIISKILHEAGTNHERSGQLAMGIAVLEDVVAVVMLTLLSSLGPLGAGGGARLGGTLLNLGAFVVLAGVAGLLLVPWLLRRMSIVAHEELQTVGIAALLFGLAVMAESAGYSLALGAFLLGVIVAETPHRHQVERTFEGMRDVFTAVFFVAIGLQIDVRVLGQSAALIAVVAAFTLVARPLAVTAGLTLIGTPTKDAVRTGLTATPIGEFSFVIAQLGAAALVVPVNFYPMAVGVSLVTTLAAPLLTRRAEAIATVAVARQPRWLAAAVRVYHGWLDGLHARRARNLLWQLSRKRVVQTGVGMLFVTGLVVFSAQIFESLEAWRDGRWLADGTVRLAFWGGLVLAVLAPLVAIWRNLSAMALLYAEVSTQGRADAARLRPLVEGGLKLIAGTSIALWLIEIVPEELAADGRARTGLLVFSAVVAVAGVVLLRRRLVYWHSEVEVELISVIETGDQKMTATTAPWLQRHTEWNLHMVDCTLPDLADCQGKKIAELALRSRFGCSVVGIERQGFMIPLPPPETALYPRDKVLLLGTTAQVAAGKEFLGAVTGGAGGDSVFGDVRMETMAVPAGSRAAGRTLGELAAARTHGVQIAGVHRGTLRLLNPGPAERLTAGDELLALGAPAQLGTFRRWLAGRTDEAAG